MLHGPEDSFCHGALEVRRSVGLSDAAGELLLHFQVRSSLSHELAEADETRGHIYQSLFAGLLRPYEMDLNASRNIEATFDGSSDFRAWVQLYYRGLTLS